MGQPPNLSLNDENVVEQRVHASKIDERTDSHSSPFTHVSGSRHSSKNYCPLASPFDKSATLELHLKWNQAFVACGI